MPLIQWSYNTTVHKSTGVTPFYAQWGYEPRQPLELLEIKTVPDQHKSLEEYVKHQQEVLTQVREALLQASFIMELYTNKSRRNPDEVKVGDEVYLSTKNIGKSHFKQKAVKLQKKFIGPYKIIERCSEYTFRLSLPKNLSKLHPVFHVALLWKVAPTPEELEHRFVTEDMNTAINPLEEDAEENNTDPPTLVDENGEKLYAVEKILDRRKAGRSYQYLIKWIGYPHEDDSWEPKSGIIGPGAIKLVKEFDRKQAKVNKSVEVNEDTPKAEEAN